MFRRLLQLQFLRFLVVGAFNTGFSYSLYAGFLWLGCHYVLANGLAFAISLLVSFATQGTVVFGITDPRRFPRFLLAWVAIFCFNIALIELLIRLGMSAYSGGAVALIPVTLLSYFIQKRLVFATPQPVRPDHAHPAPQRCCDAPPAP